MRYFEVRGEHFEIYLASVPNAINKYKSVSLSIETQTIELNLRGSVSYNEVGKYNQVINKLENVVFPIVNEKLVEDSDRVELFKKVLAENNFIELEVVEVNIEDDKYCYIDKIVGDEQIVGVFKGSDEQNNVQLELACSVGRYTINQIMQKLGYGRKHQWKSEGFWLKVLEE